MIEQESRACANGVLPASAMDSPVKSACFSYGFTCEISLLQQAPPLRAASAAAALLAPALLSRLSAGLPAALAIKTAQDKPTTKNAILKHLQPSL